MDQRETVIRLVKKNSRIRNVARNAKKSGDKIGNTADDNSEDSDDIHDPALDGWDGDYIDTFVVQNYVLQSSKDKEETDTSKKPTSAPLDPVPSTPQGSIFNQTYIDF